MGRILWITPKWLLPADDGAKVATRALLSHLPNRDEVDILSLAGDDESCDIDELKTSYTLSGMITVLRRQAVGQGISRHLRNAKRMVLSPGMPATVSRYGTNDLQSSFSDLLQTHNYTHLVLDGLHVAALSAEGNAFIKPEGVKVVYRAHNVEWQIWQRAAANASPVLRPVLNRQYKLMKAFERSVLNHADLIAPVSQEDTDTFKAECPDATIHCVPIGLDFSNDPLTMKQGGLTLGYIGRLDWPPNKDGLKWFLESVWPRIERSDVQLKIAGSGDDTWLKPLLGDERITYVGRVDAVDAFYADCHVAIVPIFYGSGTRLKMIEPASYGRPCISTEAGALGSTLTDREYFAAESADDWVDTIESLSIERCQEMAEGSRAKLKTTFDQAVIANRFTDLLKSC